MNVLIIGGTGLISTAITRILAERSHDVTVCNRGKTKNEIPPTAKAIVGDRTDYERFEAQIRDIGNFDCVIDMACFLPDEAESAVKAFHGRTHKEGAFALTIIRPDMPEVEYVHLFRDGAERTGLERPPLRRGALGLPV